jgi:hypothetical protein
MTKKETFEAAREKSERIKQDAYAAANQLALLSVECSEEADPLRIRLRRSS